MVREVRVIDDQESKWASCQLAMRLNSQMNGSLTWSRCHQTRIRPCASWDYKSELYQMKKKEKAAKKAAKEKNRPAKSMRFKVGIQDNDMEHKLKQVRRFLNKGHPASFEIQFRQRIWLRRNQRLRSADVRRRSRQRAVICWQRSQKHLRATASPCAAEGGQGGTATFEGHVPTSKMN